MRNFELDVFQGRLNNVVENIALLNEKDPVPAGFSVVDMTEDNSKRYRIKTAFTFDLCSSLFLIKHDWGLKRCFCRGESLQEKAAGSSNGSALFRY